jgi:hypothetical protein
MAKVVITPSLEEEINKKFRQKALEIFALMRTLEENPYKGKEVGVVGRLIVKEIKFENYRIYFVTDGYKIKILKLAELRDLIIKFVRISDKKNQQATIDAIKRILRSLGEEGF